MGLKCFICGNNKLTLLKQIGSDRVYECQMCDLGITSVADVGEKELIQDNEQYNFENYDTFREMYKKRFTKLIKIIKGIKKRGQVLEIGGGFGLFSSLLAKDKAYNVSIIEPYLNTYYLNTYKNTNIYKVIFEEFLVKNERYFDLVILLDVLEHFENPGKSLDEIKSILHKNGLIVIQVPNYKSFMARICKHWSWWMVGDHKFHFSEKSIKQLLITKGFIVQKFTTYEDFYDFKKNLDGNFYSIKNPVMRKIVKAFFFSWFVPTYFLLRKMIWSLSYGGLIFVVAEIKK